MSDVHQDIGEERAEARRGVSPSSVTKALLVFYLLGALFNGEHMLDQAELMPYGAWRDVCVAAARPVAAVSRATHFSAPRKWMETLPERLARTDANEATN